MLQCEFHAEVRVHEGIALFLELPIGHISEEDSGGSRDSGTDNSQIGRSNLDLGIAWLIDSEFMELAIAASLSLPTASEDRDDQEAAVFGI